MKKIRILFNLLSLGFAVFFMHSCDNEIKDIGKIEEKLELTASSTHIKLDETNVDEQILTFTWTSPREMPDDYIYSCYTEFDVVGNSFGPTTAIVNDISDRDVFSRTFTTKQILDWVVNRWKLPLTQPFSLEFRVVADWTNGPGFTPPEVRKVTVDVDRIRTPVLPPDEIRLGGSASGGSTVKMEPTLENPNKYAALMNLSAGQLNVMAIVGGETGYYYSSVDGSSALKDGETIDMRSETSTFGWNITDPGEYRVVLNLETEKITIYSPAKALRPLEVEWVKNSTPPENVTTSVTELWMYGGGTGWGWWKGNMKVSIADPQILIYEGAALTSGDGLKFAVYGESDFRNVAYAFTCPLTEAGLRQNMSLAINTVGPLHGGYDTETRNSYYRLPSGTNFIILDLRNKTIIAQKK